MKRNLLSLEVISLLFSVISTISLFGRLGVISFSEWLTNVIDAYQLLFHPLLEFLFQPILYILEFNIEPWQIDFVVVVFLFVNRFLTDIIGHELVVFISNKDTNRERRRQIYKIKHKQFKRVCIWIYKYEIKIGQYKLIIFWFVRNIFLVFSLLVLVKIFGNLDVSYKPNKIDSSDVVTFFIAMYCFPIFIALKIALGFLIGSCLYLIKFIFYILNILKKPSFIIPGSLTKEFSLLKKQAKFCLTFTFIFLLVIGVNYKYLQ